MVTSCSSYIGVKGADEEEEGEDEEEDEEEERDDDDDVGDEGGIDVVGSVDDDDVFVCASQSLSKFSLFMSSKWFCQCFSLSAMKLEHNECMSPNFVYSSNIPPFLLFTRWCTSLSLSPKILKISPNSFSHLPSSAYMVLNSDPIASLMLCTFFTTVFWCIIPAF